MSTLTLRILFAVGFTLVILLRAVAQDSTSSYELEIRKLRANIQLETNNRPPEGASAEDEALHRNNLLSFRRQLQKLLWKKTGALEVRIQNFQSPDALPEVRAHAEQLKNELSSVNDELQELERMIAGNVERALPAPPVQPDPPPTTSRSTPPPAFKSEGLMRFEENVASISPRDLDEAAIPDSVPRGVVPTCNANGRPASLTFSRLDEAICRLASDISGADPDDRREIDLENDEHSLLTILIAKLLKGKTSEGESYAAFVSEAQEKRLDQQMGAGPTSNSATSLVSKGGIPYLLGFAVENGAAEETRNDTQITFRINPGGLINLFSRKGFITGFQESDGDPFIKFLRKTSVGLTFDTNRGDTPGVFTGNRQQLAQISARVEFFNDRDPRHKRYARDWEQFVAREGVKLADQTWKTTVLLTNWGGANDDITFSDPALQAWLNETNRKVAALDPGLRGVERFNAIAKVVSEQADRVPVQLVAEKVIETLTDFARETKAYTDAKNRLFDRIARGKIFTLDYTNQREINAPDTSNFTFIASTGSAGRTSLTANGSFTFFHTRPIGTPAAPRPGRFRDFQFAGEVNVPFKVGEGQFDFWFSGKYERLMEDAIAFGGATVPNTKGDIAVGQFGLNIPIKALGIKFPVSVTFANRTELIKEKEIRGNFGFTFNWDTILSKLKPF